MYSSRALELGLGDAIDGPVQLERVQRRDVPLQLVTIAHHERDLAQERLLAPLGPVTKHARLALRRVQQPREHLERGRLARAVGTQEADHLARRDVEGDAVDRPDLLGATAHQAAYGGAQPCLALGDHVSLRACLQTR